MKNLSDRLVDWIVDKKGFDTICFKTAGLNSYTDELVICSAENKIHAKAIANHILDNCKKDNIAIFSKEGLGFGSWILLDFVDVVLHIFIPQTRAYFDIEGLYKNISKKVES